jgi:hypothetical protein
MSAAPITSPWEQHEMQHYVDAVQNMETNRGTPSKRQGVLQSGAVNYLLAFLVQKYLLYWNNRGTPGKRQGVLQSGLLSGAVTKLLAYFIGTKVLALLVQQGHPQQTRGPPIR